MKIPNILLKKNKLEQATPDFVCIPLFLSDEFIMEG